MSGKDEPNRHSLCAFGEIYEAQDDDKLVDCEELSLDEQRALLRAESFKATLLTAALDLGALRSTKDDDGVVDCEDSDCFKLEPDPQVCESVDEPICNDNYDKDDDGFVDCEDLNCYPSYPVPDKPAYLRDECYLAVLSTTSGLPRSPGSPCSTGSGTKIPVGKCDDTENCKPSDDDDTCT